MALIGAIAFIRHFLQFIGVYEIDISVCLWPPSVG
jgi:hypothetical protein